jgi:fibronectin type 3 domain-containing protein
VSLSWNASTSETVIGYNLYRADVAGGEYSKLNTARITTTDYVDSSVSSGRVYYYVTTAVDGNDVESAYSNQATAVVSNP